MAKEAFLPDLTACYALGIDPRTGLPLKLVNGNCSYPNIMNALTEIDISECVNLGTWYGLPKGVDQELIERIMYLRGQGIMFYRDTNQTFYFLPFGVSGGVDVYGRFKECIPMSFGGEADIDGDKIWLPDLRLTPVYTVQEALDTGLEEFMNGCVILTNTTRKLSQVVQPEYSIVQPVLQMMAEAYPMARTNLMANSGIRAVRVSNGDESGQVEQMNNQLRDAALGGRPNIPTIGAVDFQELTGGSGATKSEEFLLYMQSLDNFRQHLHGIGDGTIFEKKAHLLQSEVGFNESNVGLRLDDKTRCRQNFCLMCNAIWGLDMWWEPSDLITGVDKNGDGDMTTDGAENDAAMQGGEADVESDER